MYRAGSSKVEMSKVGRSKVEMTKVGTSNKNASKAEMSKVKMSKVGTSKVEPSPVRSSRSSRVVSIKVEPPSPESSPVRSFRVRSTRVGSSREVPIKVEPPSPESSPVRSARVRSCKVRSSTVRPIKTEPSTEEPPKVTSFRIGSSRVRSSTVGSIKTELSTDEPPLVELSKEKTSKGKTPKGKTPKGKTPKGKTPKGKTPKGKTPIGKTPIGKTIKGKTIKGKTPKGKTPKGKTPNEKKAMQKKKEEMKLLKRKMEENEKFLKQEKSFADLFESLTASLNAKSRVAVIKPYDDVSPSTSQSCSRNTSQGEFVDSHPLMNENIAKKNCIDTTTLKIGFIGLGNIGQRIVLNLLLTGHNVTIWNRTSMKTHQFKDMGAKVSKSPKELVEITDVIFCCVSDSEVVETLVFGNNGILSGLEGCQGSSVQKGYVEMTTIDVTLSEKIAHAILLCGGRYLEAPMCGSQSLAENGEMSITAAGDRNLFNDCASCFNAMAKSTYYLGEEIGTGSKLNLIRNSLVGISFIALAEAMVLIEKMGLSTDNFLEILRISPLGCDFFMKNGNAMRQKNFQADTTLKYMRENLNLTMALSEPVAQPMYVTSTADNVFKHAERLQYSEHDASAVYCSTKS